MKKYIVVYSAGLATRIARKISPFGRGSYTEGILEPFFPSDAELLKWSRKEVREWTRANNKRLREICKFLNEKKL